ncbi:MAG: hypothetical protein ACLSA6_00140 [Holdemania massiliensis]
MNESVDPVTAQLNAYDGVDPLSPQFARRWTGITASKLLGSANVITAWAV